ncbi:hypothetical protein PR048_025816 [Dryococelus australis]|uniref:Uncharacterized protein n=1 Tax=Dryococelus australis TaxID=614101 RepID=A0ABQ9GJN5_9NEOP|nr:hypothetical protein PR048_025816 [Dryococelus australis]
MEGWGKREIQEKTRRPTASSGTMPTCENPGETLPWIEPGSPWWEASSLTAQPPRPLSCTCICSSLSGISGVKRSRRLNMGVLRPGEGEARIRTQNLPRLKTGGAPTSCATRGRRFPRAKIGSEPTGSITQFALVSGELRGRCATAAPSGSAGASLKCKGGGKREYPEKIHQQAASSSTIPTCENPGVNPLGIKPGSPWWEASALATAPPLPPFNNIKSDRVF